MPAPSRVPLLEYPRWMRSPARARGGRMRLPPSDAWMAGVADYFANPEGLELLDRMIEGNVTLTLHDTIEFRDNFYDGQEWTKSSFFAGGSSVPQRIRLRPVSPEDDAATLVHEEVHSRQPEEMPSRQKEYEAHIAEERWRLAQGLEAGYPTFRDLDEERRVVIDEDAIRQRVDETYPGISVPREDGRLEEVIGRTRDETTGADLTVVMLDDETTYTRPPREGDTYEGTQRLEPQEGYPVNLVELRRLAAERM